ncbi:cation:proton antiporter [Oceaniserpentilla sp. 4NH20-0058]|uniref:cation:proton antiporter domain-containing protein n=1 Tax=Oceaniserpentilla sp. 4NH20-0058 TaxID=3127660 RepID=UPI0031076190
MDIIWILIAFACGFAAKQLNLPPLVGYLLAGFGMHGLGVTPLDNLQSLADLGITLMLFTIGLKINFSSLFKPTIWAGASLHMASWVLVGAILLKGFALLGIQYLEGLSWPALALIAFALSFSSTVCVVKLLEEKSEMKNLHGKLAVGILVMQDIVAVIFLVAATGKIPSIYAFGLVLLWPAKWVLGHIINKAGHGELLPLVGIALAFGGYELFNAVNLKGDLGALVFGLLLSQHNKGAELAKSLYTFKDLFLIGFFLSIGFTALPTLEMITPLAVISFILIIKGIMLFHVLAALKAPGRSMFLGSMILTNYSEFGLIVAALCVGNGWLAKEWLVIIALAVSISFIFTSIFYEHAHTAYAYMRTWVKYFERTQPTPEYQEQLKYAEVLIIGMGRVGRSSYDILHERLGNKVWGVESDSIKAQKHRDLGRHVIIGDAEDADFWETRELHHIKLIMLAMPSVTDIKDITTQLKMSGYEGHIAAIARYEDERTDLLEFGVDNVFNYFVEAGTGFAEESLHLLENDKEVLL